MEQYVKRKITKRVEKTTFGGLDIEETPGFCRRTISTTNNFAQQNMLRQPTEGYVRSIRRGLLEMEGESITWFRAEDDGQLEWSEGTDNEILNP